MVEINRKELQNYLSKTEAAQSPSIFLLFGEESLYKDALRALLRWLLPEEQREVNFAPIDGAAENAVSLVIEKLMTYSLMPGKSVVGLLDARLFYRQQDKNIFLAKAKTAYDEKETKRAAKYFWTYMQRCGITPEDFDSEQTLPSFIDNSALKGDTAWIMSVVALCRDIEKPKTSSQDDHKMIQQAIERGFPTGNVLIITTDLVDRRKKLYLTLKEQGVVVDCSVPFGNRHKDRIVQQKVMQERMNVVLKRSGKTLGPGAAAAIFENIGFDLRVLGNSIEKLINFSGERKLIGVEDVSAVLKRSKQDPIYAFTNAAMDRDLGGALFFMETLLTGGENTHPLQLLAAITNQVRKLLLAKGFVESAHGTNWQAECQYPYFQKQVLPALKIYQQEILTECQNRDLALTAEENAPHPGKAKKKGKKKALSSVTDLILLKPGGSAYAAYQLLRKADNFTHDELLEVLSLLADSDHKIKSTGQDGRQLVERIIFRLCAGKYDRQ